jgi:tetratricopeptide (TPR) repeat protein
VQAAAAALLTTLACSGLAATNDTEARYDAALEATKSDAADLDKAFAFVKAAIAAGDLTGAVAALERILRINPALANIELELGVLYLRLGAPDLAAKYIEQSLESPDVPPWVRNRALGLLARAEAAKSRHQVAYSFSAAGRYDDNANAAPFDADVRVFGQNGQLSDEDTGQDDTSTELVAGLNYIYAFDSQAGNHLEVDASTYHRKYDELSELDVNTARIEVGPRFHFGPILSPSTSLRPYVSSSLLYLDGDKYLVSYGGGFNVRALRSSTLVLDLFFDYDEQDYSDTDSQPTADDRSGPLYTALARVTLLPSPASLLTVDITGGVREADADFEDRDQYGARAAYTHYISTRASGRPLFSLNLWGGAEWLEYQAADPTVDPNEERDDTRLTAGIGVGVPFGQHWNALLSVQYTDNDSSLPNFEYDNWGASLGVRGSF